MPAPKLNLKVIHPIDIDNLQLEWVMQDQFYDYWAEKQAKAQERRDYAKNREALIFSQVTKKMRRKWKKYFETKPTEPAIKAEALDDKKYKQAQKDLINTGHDLNTAINKLRQLEHRKRALEKLSSFFIGGFYSEPNMKRVKKDVDLKGKGKKKKKKKKK